MSFVGGAHANSDQKTEVTPEKTKTYILDKLYSNLKSAKSSKSAGTIAGAIEELWLKSGSDTVDLLMHRAGIALSQNNQTLALELLDTVVVLKPNYTEGWSRRAKIYFAEKAYSKALLDLRRVLALDPQNFRAVHGLAMTLQETGKKKQALNVYRKLLKIHPFMPSAQNAVEELVREVEGQDS
ncbi:MAG: tetratricopeptide repeat protein [Pseudomonadota bacterium]